MVVSWTPLTKLARAYASTRDGGLQRFEAELKRSLRQVSVECAHWCALMAVDKVLGRHLKELFRTSRIRWMNDQAEIDLGSPLADTTLDRLAAKTPCAQGGLCCDCAARNR